MKLPLYFRFRATDLPRAFTLASMVSAVVVVLGATFKDVIEMAKIPKEERDNHPRTSWGSVFISMLLTFVTAMIVYALMFFIFGYGGGMLVDGAQPVTQRTVGRKATSPRQPHRRRGHSAPPGPLPASSLSAPPPLS